MAGEPNIGRAVSARRKGARPSVFVHELLDPRGHSLTWLEEQGVEVQRGCPTWGDRFFTEDELIERARGYTALMGASIHKISRKVMESLPDLAYVSKYGIGVDSIDMRAASDLGILVTNTPVPENWEAVAEYTIAAILALKKQLLFYSPQRLREGGWRTDEAWSSFLRHNTIGLIGLGRIGRSVVERLDGWDCRVIAHDPYLHPDIATDMGVDLVDLDVLLRESDVVSLHCLLNDDTRHLIDEHALGLMKETALLINSARGGLVDLDALDACLVAGGIAGTAMDAYESEPPAFDHPIFTRANVIATPHTSAWVEETFVAIARAGAENVHAALTGGDPPFPVNPEVLGE